MGITFLELLLGHGGQIFGFEVGVHLIFVNCQKSSEDEIVVNFEFVTLAQKLDDVLGVESLNVGLVLNQQAITLIE